MSSTSRITFVQGDAKPIRRFVTAIPQDQTATKAWFTVKVSAADADQDAKIAKIITTQASADGLIEDAGAGGTATVRFDLQSEDTADLVAGQRYLYDIQVLLSGGGPYTPELGTFVVVPQITQADA